MTLSAMLLSLEVPAVAVHAAHPEERDRGIIPSAFVSDAVAKSLRHRSGGSRPDVRQMLREHFLGNKGVEGSLGSAGQQERRGRGEKGGLPGGTPLTSSESDLAARYSNDSSLLSPPLVEAEHAWGKGSQALRGPTDRWVLATKQGGLFIKEDPCRTLRMFCSN